METQPSKLTILGTEYIVDDVIDVGIVDSFVKVNKIGIGHGEARLYLGSQRYNWDDFFEVYEVKNCFFYKQHLVSYMENAKFEYENQEQVYNKDISENYNKNFEKVSNLEEIEYFSILKANGSSDGNRFYIKSEDKIYTIFREISLPVITNLSILKLRANNEVFFLFRPFINYFEDTRNISDILKEEAKIIQNDEIDEKQKDEIIKSRVGQGKYRNGLIEEMRECLITGVNDERMLVASHIKPWRIADDDEKIDKFNGLLLTPTYDRLFDQGFISFNDDGTLLVSPYLSPLNIKRLSLKPDCKYNLLYNKKRSEYLEFHRNNIFKKG